jgi:predicted nucleotidyltransferase component of viral defense system
MKGKTPVNVGASVRARLLKLSKERHEDVTLMLMNYAAERFLYRLSRSSRREQFVLKGAMLFAVRIGELYRPTRDLDLLGVGEHSEAAIEAAIRDIVVTPADDDGVSFDLGTLQVHPIREDNRDGGIRAIMEAQLTEARIHVQIDVGFGDAITPAALDLDFPTLLANMPAPNVLAYPTETIVAEKVEAMVELGRSNSRMKDFTDLAMAARRIAFDGDALVAAIRATFRRRHTPVPDGEIVALTEEFTGDERAQANWRAFSGRNQLRGFESLERVVAELRPFLLPVIAHARTDGWFGARWNPGGPWLENSPTPR